MMSGPSISGSGAYCGHVVHARTRPRKHRLRYSVFYLLLDLEELAALDSRLRLFAYNRRGLFSFHDRDHGPRDGSDLRFWVDTQLAEAGLAIPGGRVKLLCLPRILGYVFNPLSVYFCFDRDENLRAVLYQVSNTFSESHTYVLPVGEEVAADRIVRHAFDKTFYVSPFIPMSCRYHITLRNPDEHASIAIRETDGEGDLLAATFHGQRHNLNDTFLSSTLLKFPLLTFKVIAGIHWDAAKLWLKRTPVFRHPPRPSHTVSVIPQTGTLPNVRARAN